MFPTTTPDVPTDRFALPLRSSSPCRWRSRRIQSIGNGGGNVARQRGSVAVADDAGVAGLGHPPRRPFEQVGVIAAKVEKRIGAAWADPAVQASPWPHDRQEKSSGNHHNASPWKMCWSYLHRIELQTEGPQRSRALAASRDGYRPLSGRHVRPAVVLTRPRTRAVRSGSMALYARFQAFPWIGGTCIARGERSFSDEFTPLPAQPIDGTPPRAHAWSLTDTSFLRVLSSPNPVCLPWDETATPRGSRHRRLPARPLAPWVSRSPNSAFRCREVAG